MVRFELGELMERINMGYNTNITLASISKETGIHRTVLSRIKNHPHTTITSIHLDLLLEYFYQKLLSLEIDGDEKNLSKNVLLNFITFIPKDVVFEVEKICNGDCDRLYSRLCVTHMWNVYNKRNGS